LSAARSALASCGGGPAFYLSVSGCSVSRLRRKGKMFNRVRRAVAKILMPPLNMMAAFFQKATAHGSRSTVLKPLAWLIGLCVTATLGALKWSAPVWLLVTLSVCLTMSITLYLGAYIYCLYRNADLLRTETYLIQQLAIQKGLLGDSVVGVFQPEPEAGIIPINSSSGTNSGGEQK
jgi:hypothetical protein